MNRDNHDLSPFNDDQNGLFPRGFFPSFFNDSLWNGLNFGGFKVDVMEKKDAYVIDAELPGIDKNNVNIDIDDNMLTISANVDEHKEEKDESGRYLRRERRSGSYRRSFPLDNIKADEIKAEMNNGILTVRCPKKQESRPNTKRIPIQ